MTRTPGLPAALLSLVYSVAAAAVPGCSPDVSGEQTGAVTGAVTLPGRIEAEGYRAGGEGLGFHDTTAGNTGGAFRAGDDVDIEATTDAGGGFDVGWTAAGEWLAYDVSASAGTYTFTVRVASGVTGTKSLHLEIDGTAVTPVLSFTSSGGWQSWLDLTAAGVTLTEGPHTLRLVTETGRLNVNYIQAVQTAVADGGAPNPNYGGLFTRSETNRTRWSPALQQYWLHANWSALEPSPGVYDWTPITSYLSAHPDVNVRLHIGGGDNAPAWLAGYAGAFVDVTNTRDSITRACGRYWTTGYKNRFRSFVAALGARFGQSSRIVSVNNFGNSLVYDEPWLMGGDTASVARLYAAGLNHDTAMAAQYAAMAALTAAFPRSVVEMPGHGTWDYPADATGRITHDWVGGRAIVNALHDRYGKYVIFTDYGLGPTEYTAAAASLATASSYYAWMHKRADLGFPIGFQLTLTSSGSAPSTTQMLGAVQAAIDMGARWVEHSDFSLLTNTQVQSFDRQLKANVE